MAKLPPIARLSREDFPDAPGWLDKLLTPLNATFSAVYSALNGGLTPGDNLRAQVKTLDLNPSALPVTLASTIGKPLEVRVAQAVEKASKKGAAGTVGWDYDGKGGVVVRSLSGLTAGTTYSVTFIFVGG